MSEDEYTVHYTMSKGEDDILAPTAAHGSWHRRGHRARKKEEEMEEGYWAWHYTILLKVSNFERITM